MNHKDNENEGIGIIAIIIIVILAAIGLYFFFASHRPPTAVNGDTSVNVPLEAPSPLPDNTNQ